MMTNLFSMFDPCNFYFKMNWLASFILLLLIPMKTLSKSKIILNILKNSLSKEFFTLTESKMSINFLIPLFISILTMNLLSMIPSSFALSAQMAIVMPMAMVMWTKNVTFFLSNKMNKFLIHMVPTGSPNILMPIMVLIEMVSNLIRPITLSVRLVANITAGHLLMHLLSSFSCKSMNSPIIIVLIMFSLILNMLEMGVAFIQSYIMCTLIALYSNEIH